jgi:hypothetical protein
MKIKIRIFVNYPNLIDRKRRINIDGPVTPDVLREASPLLKIRGKNYFGGLTLEVMESTKAIKQIVEELEGTGLFETQVVYET